MAAGWAGTGAGGSGGVVSAALVGGPKPGAGEWGVNRALSREPNASITAAVLVKTGLGTSLPLPGPSHFTGRSWELGAGGHGRTGLWGTEGTASEPCWAPLPWVCFLGSGASFASSSSAPGQP